MSSEILFDLLDYDGPYPRAWIPKPGEKLLGVVDGFAIWDSGFGPYPIVIVLADDGEVCAVHAAALGLRAELDRERPRVGERVAFRYSGRSRTEKASHLWRVVVQRDRFPSGGSNTSNGAEEDAWDQLLDPDAQLSSDTLGD